MRQIIIVGDPTDPHIEAVIGCCAARGAECNVISDEGYKFTLHVDIGDISDRHAVDGPGTLDARFPSAVWWRRKPNYFRLENSDSHERFRDREWAHALEGLEGAFKHAKWVNPRIVDRYLRHKPNQLLLAGECGLTTPRTLLSNDSARVLEFIAQLPHGKCIYKPFSWFHVSGRSIYTTVITAKMVEENIAGISKAPGIFQEYIEKRYELRITVVGDCIFAVKIDSQARDDTKIDWRRNQYDAPYSRIQLEQEFEAALCEFHRRSGLVYGAYDVVHGADGRYVFLEVNPVGQWLWLEEAVGVQISDALAAELVG
jgi:hypothetical protein